MEAKELVPYSDIERMAVAVCKSGLFGIKNVEAAISLMLLCQSEGLHPIQAVRRFDVLPNGKVSMKAEAMLAEFQARGGKVEWHQISDEQVVATFDAPGLTVPVMVKWTVGDAKRAGLLSKDNWQKYPRQMLRARVITDGVKMALPAAGLGLYPTEVAQDFDKDDLSPVLEASIEKVRKDKGGSESIPEASAAPSASGTPAEEEPPVEKATKPGIPAHASGPWLADKPGDVCSCEYCVNFRNNMRRISREEEPPDTEAPALFEVTMEPEEAKRLIEEHVATMALQAPNGEASSDADTQRWLTEKGLGQKCVKCDGIVEKHTSRTGRLYLQCSKAYALREDALKAGCDEKTAKGFTKGHSYAYL